MNGNIYKLSSIYTDKFYIGSTLNTIKDRLLCHELKYKSWLYNLNNEYCTSYEILKYKEYNIELLENYLCSVRSELETREGYYQTINFSNCVNTIIAGGRPRCKKINEEQIYLCYCGKSMLNQYRTRYKHTKTNIHKNNVRAIHEALNI